MLFGDTLFSLSMVALLVDGLLQRLMGLMGVAFRSTYEKLGTFCLPFTL